MDAPGQSGEKPVIGDRGGVASVSQSDHLGRAEPRPTTGGGTSIAGVPEGRGLGGAAVGPKPERLPASWAGELASGSRGKNEPAVRKAQWSPWAPAEPAGSPVVSEERFNLLSTLDLRQEMRSPRVFKSFLSTCQARPDPLQPSSLPP